MTGRRELLAWLARGAALAGLSGLGAALAGREAGERWQIDPARCSACGRCATACVQAPSAATCVHAFDMCGYCALCGGYHRPDARPHDSAAENQLCPTGALVRTFVETPFYEYRVDEALCIGCARCVAGCAAFGNGSLYLQISGARCRGCNECAIARACPSGAVRRVPPGRPYLPKGASA